ncbi:MAG: IS30 family transposase [Myxococcaceae bacterium]
MARRGRPGLSIQQKQELWRRWRSGQTLSEIGRALGKHAASVYGVLASNGGLSPARRKRSVKALTMDDREEISRSIARGKSVRAIADRVERSPSTISREIERNGGRSKYRAARADERAWDQAKRPKDCLLLTNRRLGEFVATKLKADWSPQQISGWLAAFGSKRMRISHETIYRSLYLQARGVLSRELLERLRTRRKMRRAKGNTTAGQTRGQIVGAVSIHDRPAAVETRLVPGHWEGDLLTGARNSHIATLVERYSRYVLLIRVEGKDSETVCRALTAKVTELPRGLFRSLTWDRGTELAFHKRFTQATGVPVYFCDPKSPWQRGTNENTNRLLRQYFPDGVDLSTYSQHDLDFIAVGLNRRPRKTLGYLSPRDRITGAVAPIR